MDKYSPITYKDEAFRFKKFSLSITPTAYINTMVHLSWIILALLPVVALTQTITYEAESGVLFGATIGSSVAGFSGTFSVRFYMK